jgi:hypothetical protein
MCSYWFVLPWDIDSYLLLIGPDTNGLSTILMRNRIAIPFIRDEAVRGDLPGPNERGIIESVFEW